MKSIKHKITIGILSAGLFLAFAVAVIQAIEHSHLGRAQFSYIFWGVLFGYWLIAILNLPDTVCENLLFPVHAERLSVS